MGYAICVRRSSGPLPTLLVVLFTTAQWLNEGTEMNIKTRRCLSVVGVAAIVALYATSAYRVEMARQAPQVASCSFGHCVPANATFSALR